MMIFINLVSTAINLMKVCYPASVQASGFSFANPLFSLKDKFLFIHTNIIIVFIMMDNW